MGIFELDVLNILGFKLKSAYYNHNMYCHDAPNLITARKELPRIHAGFQTNALVIDICGSNPTYII